MSFNHQCINVMLLKVKQETNGRNSASSQALLIGIGGSGGGGGGGGGGVYTQQFFTWFLILFADSQTALVTS